ncbi:MAG: hypothetical protein MUC51_09005 [Anaerolineae bacterium]|jgi:hypothetical protein|nr:hypothetical protein [Anaerolineae bacterium]
MSSSEWYTLIAAVVLLGLALLNSQWMTLLVSVVGVIAGIVLVARGPLKRGGMFAFAGFVIAGALAIFSLMLAK